MKIRACAKINLALDVLGKDQSGYHFIRTVFQETPELYDEIEIEESAASTENQVAIFLKKKFGIEKNVKIKIAKNIPRGSGLGGESSCAAAILKALNKIWELKLTADELQKIAAKFGMDAPFFILGGTTLGTHFGEEITPLPFLKNITFTIIPRFSQNFEKTKTAYAGLDLKKCGHSKNMTEKLIAAIKNNDHKAVIENIHNDFETLTPARIGEHLSGSGPSTYSIEHGNGIDIDMQKMYT